MFWTIRVNGRAEAVIAGALMIAGIVIAVVGEGYGLGSLRRIGPGFFPTWLGIALAALSAMAALKALTVPGDDIVLELRCLLWTAIGITGFALLIELASILAAALAMVCCVALGQGRFNPLREVATAVGLSIGGYLIFGQILGIPVSLIAGLL